MRISELREKEALDGIVRQTLEAGWSEQYRVDFRVGDSAKPGAQPWRVQSILSAYCVPSVRSRPRRFLRDSFRFTQVRHRLLPQLIFGSLLASRLGLLLFGGKSFWVSPPLANAKELLVIPGNRRVCVFDFQNDRLRVFRKIGFESSSISAEVNIRSRGIPGPFLKIAIFDPDYQWYEEPLISGFNLARCPPWKDHSKFKAEAVEKLSGWLEGTTEERNREEYMGRLQCCIEVKTGEFQRKFGKGLNFSGWVEELAKLACADQPNTIRVAQTHGDFQEGNVIVDPVDERVYLVDWEFTATRSVWYDGLVAELGARSPKGLSRRVKIFLSQGGSSSYERILPAAEDRRAAIAVFFLEEWLRILEENLSGPLTNPSLGFGELIGELADVNQAILEK